MAGGVTGLVIVIGLAASLQLYISHVSDLDASKRLLPSNLSLGWAVLLGGKFRGRFGIGHEDVLLLLDGILTKKFVIILFVLNLLLLGRWSKTSIV